MSNNLTPVELGIPRTAEKLYPQERLLQKQAFEYYYYMGRDRTMPKVAKKFDVGLRTIVSWAQKFEWKARIESRDVELSKMAISETDHQVKETKKTFLGIIRHMIDKKAVKDVNGVVVGVEGLDIKNVKDLRECIEAYREVIGEGGSRQQPGQQSAGTNIQVNLIVKKG